VERVTPRGVVDMSPAATSGDLVTVALYEDRPWAFDFWVLETEVAVLQGIFNGSVAGGGEVGCGCRIARRAQRLPHARRGAAPSPPSALGSLAPEAGAPRPAHPFLASRAGADSGWRRRSSPSPPVEQRWMISPAPPTPAREVEACPRPASFASPRRVPPRPASSNAEE
jgi:hypothetical protein